MAKYDDKQLLLFFVGSLKTRSEDSAGPNVFICDECIELCQEIIDEEFVESFDYDLRELPKPANIKETLDDYVIKQERAKEPWLLQYIIITKE